MFNNATTTRLGYLKKLLYHIIIFHADFIVTGVEVEYFCYINHIPKIVVFFNTHAQVLNNTKNYSHRANFPKMNYSNHRHSTRMQSC